MTEAESTQPAAEARKRSYWHVCGMAVGILVFPSLVVTARKTGIWPNTVVGLVTFGIPFLLIGVRSWDRWFHPERMPVRWKKDSFLNKHHDMLDAMLNLLWSLFFAIALFLDERRHFEAKLVSYFVLLACQGWLSLLKLYSTDRKYIPPPAPPYDPSNVTRSKPLQSELWGRHYVADSDPNEVS